MMIYRWLINTRKEKPDNNTHNHPATNLVKNYLSGSERCLVVWGLSPTISCCQNIANGIMHEKGLAKIFRCDKIARDHTPLNKFFLGAFACKSLDDFVKFLPKSHMWLIFDSLNQLNEDMITFFQDLIELSYKSSKFKLLLFTHKTDIACSILKWSETHHPIQIVEPIARCQSWTTSHHDISVEDPDTAQQTLGITRLNRFIREEWAQSGAFTVNADRLAQLS
jgi:hypothetical protein